MERIHSFVTLLTLFSVAGGKARAEYLFNNGPINGMGQIQMISTAEGITNSFYLTNASNLTGAEVGIWVIEGQVPITLDWSIGTTAYGSNFGSGTATLTNEFHNQRGIFTVYKSTIPLTGTFPGNLYWLTLKNASTPAGGPVYWDENGSLLSSAQGPPNKQSINAESLAIIGDKVTPSPEPGSLMLLSIGVGGMAAYCWRRKRLTGCDRASIQSTESGC